MSHWAELDENNIVIRVVVGDNDKPGEGYQELVDNLGGRWVQTSYNGNFRKQFAGFDFAYDEANDVFISPPPFPSWVLNESFDWEPPVARPREDRLYFWNEETVSWTLPPSPFPSWVLVDDMWAAPNPRPEEGFWIWNELELSWQERSI
jgi:hypothetical protein